MKILACTDGSKHSQKTLEKAAMIAGGCKADDVVVIYVYEEKSERAFVPLFDINSVTKDTVSEEEVERLKKLQQEHQAQREKILADAAKIFEEKGVQARTVLKQGHAANQIVKLAEDEGFDLILIGSRGMGGLQKLLLGSVSSAVIQEVKNCSVLMVK